MKHEIQIKPPNSVVLIMDYAAGVIPESMAGKLVASTSSCIAVGTLSEADGLTRISISDQTPTDVTESPIFDGVLDTPNRHLSVCSAHNEALMVIPVGGGKTSVRIWANHPFEPDRINIVVT
jgi:hypothetical protein